MTLNEMDEMMGLPRVQASCDYRHPLRFEDEMEIRLSILELKNRSIRYGFRFLKLLPDETFVEVATGAMTVVCVQKSEKGVMKAVSLPTAIVQHLEEASLRMDTQE